MATLDEITEAIKSANAGASWLTFDIVFPDEATYRSVADSGAIGPELVSTLYKVDAASVAIHHCDPVRTIKVTIPRRSFSGGRDESDFDGTQQYAPLLDIEVPDPP